MQEQEKSMPISLEEYINRQIAGYIEIINKAQGAIEALTQMKESVVKANEQEAKGKTNEKENAGAGRGGRAVPAGTHELNGTGAGTEAKR